MAVQEFALSVPWLRRHLHNRNHITSVRHVNLFEEQLILTNLSIGVQTETLKLHNSLPGWNYPRHCYLLQVRAVLMEGACPAIGQGAVN